MSFLSLFTPRILYILAAILSVALGIATLWVSPLWILAGVGLLAGVAVYIKRPETTLLGILAITATIFDYEQLPFISIGIGRMGTMDIVLLIPLAMVILSWLSNPKFKLVHTPLDLPLILFYCTAMLSTGIAIFQSTLRFNDALSEMRSMNFYMSFFLTVNIVREKRQLQFLLKAFLFFGVFVALAMIGQYFLGESVPILPGRVETVQTGNIVSSGATRVLPPGQSTIMVTFIIYTVLMVTDKSFFRGLSKIVSLIVLGFAVLITFNRNFWVGIAVSIIMLVFVLPWRQKNRFILNIILALSLAAGGLLIAREMGFNSNFVDAVLIRIGSINLSATQESSLQWRKLENEYAIPKIISKPVLGGGLGSEYRPPDSRLNNRGVINSLLNYIHNGYFWVMLKTGLAGFVFLMWFLAFAAIRGLNRWQHIEDPFLRAIVLSITLAISGIGVAAIFNPIFRQSDWTSLLGIMLGANEIIYRLYKPGQNITPTTVE